MTKDELLQQAYNVLEYFQTDDRVGYEVWETSKAIEVMTSIEKVLAPSKFWTVLTDTQIHKINEDFEQDHGSLAHTRAIEAKLKELNQ